MRILKTFGAGSGRSSGGDCPAGAARRDEHGEGRWRGAGDSGRCAGARRCGGAGAVGEV